MAVLSFFHPAVQVDLWRAIGRAVWHENRCDSLEDSAWPCNCKRSRR